MASFIQEPDMRTLVAITDCVYAMCQGEVQSCAALYSVADNDAAFLPSSSVAKRIRMSRRNLELLAKTDDAVGNSKHVSGRSSNDTFPSSIGVPAPSVSSSSIFEKDANEYPQGRQEKVVAGYPRQLSPPRVTGRRDDASTKNEGSEEFGLVSVEETRLGNSSLHDDRRHSMRRDHHHHHHEKNARLNCAARAAKNDLLPAKESGRDSTAGKQTNSKQNNNVSGGPRTRELNVASMPHSAATQTNRTRNGLYRISVSSPLRQVGEAKCCVKKPTSLSTTCTSTAASYTASNYTLEKPKDKDIMSANPVIEAHSCNSHHSSYFTIDLSEVRPKSSTSSVRTESQSADHYVVKNETASHALRASSPSSALHRLSPPECFRREIETDPRIIRASHSADTNGFTTKTWSFTSLKGKCADGSTFAYYGGGDRKTSRDDASQRCSKNNSSNSNSFTSAASVQSTSPLTITAAAAARAEGSVASHDTGASQVSVRSTTNPLSNQGSLVPTASPLAAAVAAAAAGASGSAYPAYDEKEQSNSHEPRGKRGSSRSITGTGKSSMRRDHHVYETLDRRAYTRDSSAVSASAAARAVQSTRRFVLDTRRRLLPKNYEEEKSTQTAQSRSSATPTKEKYSGINSHCFYKDDAWAATPSASPDAAVLRNKEATPCSHLSSAASSREQHARYTTTAEAGLDPMHHADLNGNSNHYLSYTSASKITNFGTDGGPRLASSPLRPHRTLSLPAPLSKPRFLPQKLTNDNTGCEDEEIDRASLLRAAVHHMQQAGGTAVDSGAMFSPLPLSAEDRYALLVESARLLSSSMFITALAQRDRYASISAARSASSVSATTLSPSQGWQSHHVVPFSLEKPLAETSISLHGAATRAPFTSVLDLPAPRRDGPQTEAGLLTSPSAPPPQPVCDAARGQIEDHSDRNEASLCPRTEHREHSEDSTMSESNRSSLEWGSQRQTVRRPHVVDAKLIEARPSASLQQERSSIGSGAASSLATEVAARQRLVPLPNGILETSQVSRLSSVASSVHTRSESHRGALSKNKTNGVGEVGLSENDKNENSSESGIREVEQEVPIHPHSEGDVDANREEAISSAYSSVAREAAPARPALLPATQLFQERHSVEDHNEEKKEDIPVWEVLKGMETQRRYYSYVSPVKVTRTRERGERGLFPPVESPHASSFSVSPLTPPPLANREYHSLLHVKAALHSCQHSEEAQNMETSDTVDIPAETAAQSEQPNLSERSPHSRKSKYRSAPKKPADVYAVYNRPASDKRESLRSQNDNAGSKSSVPAGQVQQATEPLGSGGQAIVSQAGEAHTLRKGASGVVEEEPQRDEQYVETQTFDHSTHPSSEYVDSSNKEDDDDVAHHPRRVCGHSDELVKNGSSTDHNGATLTNPSSLPHAHLTDYHSMDSAGTVFDWVDENYAAAHQRYRDQHSADGGSPLNAPSASESHSSFGHILYDNNVRSNGNIQAHGGRPVSSSFSVEGLSNSGALPLTSPNSTTAAATVTHPSIVTSSSVPFSDLPHLRDSTDPKHSLHAHQSAPSFSFTGSFASTGVQSAFLAERTPTAPSVAMMHAAEMEMSASDLQIPRAAALFSDPLVSRSMSLAVEPQVEGEGDLKGSEERKVHDEKVYNAVHDASAEEAQEWEEALWVDESGHYFTQPDLIDHADDTRELLRPRKEAIVTGTTGSTGAEQSPRNAAEPAQYSGVSALESGQSVNGGDAKNDADNDIQERAPPSSRRSTLLRRSARCCYQQQQQSNKRPSDGSVDASAQSGSLTSSTEVLRKRVQMREIDEGNDENGDPPRRICYTDSLASVMTATKDSCQSTAGNSRYHSSSMNSSQDDSTMSSASTSPERNREQSCHEGRQSRQSEEERSAWEMQQRNPSASSSPPPMCEALCGNGGGARADTAVAAGSTFSVHQPGMDVSSDMRHCGIRSGFYKEPHANRGSSLLHEDNTSRSGKRLANGEPGHNRGGDGRAHSTNKADTVAIADGRFSTADMPPGHNEVCSVSRTDDAANAVIHPFSAADRSTSCSLSLSSSTHLPPPLPTANAAGSWSRLAVPGALSKPPIAPTVSRSRFAGPARNQALLSPAPSVVPARVGANNKAATQAEYTGRGNAFADHADFFEEEEDEDGYCSYGYSEEYMDV